MRHAPRGFGTVPARPRHQWRAAIGAGASAVSGNARSSSLNVTADAVRATAADQWSLYGSALRGSNRGGTTAEQYRLGEESSHKLTPTTSFKQRLIVYPNLSDSGAYRASFDAGLAVAISGKMSLTVTLGERYNSDPGVGLKKSDTVLFTGLTVKYD